MLPAAVIIFIVRGVAQFFVPCVAVRIEGVGHDSVHLTSVFSILTSDDKRGLATPRLVLASHLLPRWKQTRYGRSKSTYLFWEFARSTTPEKTLRVKFFQSLSQNSIRLIPRCSGKSQPTKDKRQEDSQVRNLQNRQTLRHCVRVLPQVCWVEKTPHHVQSCDKLSPLSCHSRPTQRISVRLRVVLPLVPTSP